ncbi:MAG TPA: DUF3999 family protein, partial [Vicinamibacteria bacterium]
MTRLVLLAAAVGVAAAPPDAERSAWRYRRAVLPPPGAESAYLALPVPPEVAAQGQGDLSDLRLVAADGGEVAYVVDHAVERASLTGIAGRLVDTRREPLGAPEEQRGRSVWVADFGEPRRFDTVWLDIPGGYFAKRVRVEASGDGQGWRLLQESAGVFDAPWSTPARVHHTTVHFDPAESARYLRLTMLDDRRSPPVAVTGVTVAETRWARGEDGRRAVVLDPQGGRPRSRYRLQLPPRFPFEEIAIDTADPLFARRVRLLEVTAGGGQERVLGDAVLYRLRLKDAALAGERLSLRLQQRPEAGALVLEVDDGDSPPLRGLRAEVSGAAARLLFAAAPGPLTLYYGNDVTRAPRYDLEPLRDRLALSGELATARLGPEAENPRHQKPAPLPFTAARGATVAARGWRALRRLTLGGQEDLWTVALAAEDLAVARPDLGDLRVVDDKDAQVPYILEPAAVERRVELSPEKPTRTGEGGRVTRHRWRVGSLPISALELDAQEPFFDRPARLLAPASGSRHERTLFAGRLARALTVDARAAAPPAPRPIVIPLDGSRLEELTLEIDEGDNAPLALQSAHALVRAPRLTFKAAPGAYRVLLGNREADAPRYDLASLRQEVLSYSAVETAAAPREPNPAYRRFAGDYFSDAPP